MAKGQKNNAIVNSQAQKKFLDNMNEKGLKRFEIRSIPEDLLNRFKNFSEKHNITYSQSIELLLNIYEKNEGNVNL